MQGSGQSDEEDLCKPSDSPLGGAPAGPTLPPPLLLQESHLRVSARFRPEDSDNLDSTSPSS